MAYESGQFFKLQVNTGALKLCETFLDQVSDATGKHGYTKAGEGSSRKPGDHGTKFPIEKGEALTAVAQARIDADANVSAQVHLDARVELQGQTLETRIRVEPAADLDAGSPDLVEGD
ncbi:MAG TPA: hypothetical protein EYP98_05040, partial [Planctomycetes bacterium]|nr:hypothetical protein [Planctomycetota bacterium]